MEDVIGSRRAKVQIHRRLSIGERSHDGAIAATTNMVARALRLWKCAASLAENHHASPASSQFCSVWQGPDLIRLIVSARLHAHALRRAVWVTCREALAAGVHQVAEQRIVPAM